MALETSVTGKVLTVILDDELTIYTANDFRDLLAEQLKNITHIVVNLSKVTEIDTAGLQFMIAVKNLGAEYEIDFVELSPAVLDVLEVCGLSGQFDDSVILLRESTV
jgi:anti-sigma B factor antagonist